MPCLLYCPACTVGSTAVGESPRAAFHEVALLLPCCCLGWLAAQPTRNDPPCLPARLPARLPACPPLQVGKEPSQCLRYCFDAAAKPLWPSCKNIPGPGGCWRRCRLPSCVQSHQMQGTTALAALPAIQPPAPSLCPPQPTYSHAHSLSCACHLPQRTSPAASAAGRPASLSSKSCRRWAPSTS